MSRSKICHSYLTKIVLCELIRPSAMKSDQIVKQVFSNLWRFAGLILLAFHCCYALCMLGCRQSSSDPFRNLLVHRLLSVSFGPSLRKQYQYTIKKGLKPFGVEKVTPQTSPQNLPNHLPSLFFTPESNMEIFETTGNNPKRLFLFHLR